MDNSAFRLLTILEAGKNYPGNYPCVRAWKDILGAETELEVPEKYGYFLRLVGETANDVLQISPSSEDAVAHWRGRILAAMSSSHMSSAWEGFISNIDSHTFSYLRMQADLINGKTPKNSIDTSQLAKAREHLQIALNEIRDSRTLKAETRIALISKIQAIISAIDNYHIVGQEYIFDAVKVVYFDMTLAKQEGIEVPGKSNIREGLSIIADLMSMADGAIALSGPIMQLVSNLP
jgi:hypothetical protein